jgi:hypothetical protein
MDCDAALDAVGTPPGAAIVAGMVAATVIGSKRLPNSNSKAAEDETSGNPKAYAMNAHSTLEEVIYFGDWPLLHCTRTV